MKEKRVAKYRWVYDDEKFKYVSRIRKFKESTKKNMAVALNEYCGFIKAEHGTEMTPLKLYQESSREQNTIVDNYITPIDDRKVGMYIAGYMEYVESMSLAPRTKSEYIRNVRQFYTILKIVLPDLKIKKPDSKEENHYIPKLEDLQRALAANRSVRNKAILLTQCSSGMGTGELLALTKDGFWKGYDIETGITMFHPTRKKTGRRYRTFITPEASDAIKDWLLVADTKDTRLFELGEFGVLDVYHRLNDNAGFDTPKGQYDNIRSHNMRKYFHNTLMNHGCSLNLINYLCGRSESEVERTYGNWEDDVLRTEYLKYMEYLSVSPLRVKVIESAEYTNIKAELDTERAKNAALEARLAGLEDKVNQYFTHVIDGEEMHERNPDFPLTNEEIKDIEKSQMKNPSQDIHFSVKEWKKKGKV